MNPTSGDRHNHATRVRSVNKLGCQVFKIVDSWNIWIFSNISISATQVDGCYHLKTFLNIAGPDVLSVGAGPEAQSVLKRMEREATHRYQTLTLPEDRAANCIFVNGSLVHRGRQEAPKSQPVSELFTLVLCNRIGISLSNHSFWLTAH